MKLIANVDTNWGIGKMGDLLFHIPEDLRFFRDQTLGKTVVMGRGTLESLPGGKPLPGRRNIVLSRTMNEDANGVTICRNLEDVRRAVQDTPPDDVFLIGGSQAYKEMLPDCTTAYVTKVDADGGADCFMRNLDEDPDWVLAETIGEGQHGALHYRFCRYGRESVREQTREDM